ncbi:hypothetical protein EIN_118950 [Entamoeba invadens IP1]|uniref:Uncharacterized protein n=1 Tax=Entamoeba invadens IP1 TaxID=370355 RepID=L7FNS3_ENTIV|nr:hypothetical protein EIN_118950 [Entamoeba invadens IP1]ELP92271.1 hypothetical protein EIN_118950 [Entamoeba invadens IP1]|eukprot:XP_004259042.1 hypothetical protein EIN_118950 [Entamoeba invadens IP1]
MNGQVNGVGGLYFIDYLDEMKNTNSSVYEIAQLYDDNTENESNNSQLVKSKEKVCVYNKKYLSNCENANKVLKTNPVISREFYLLAQKIYTQYKKLFDEAEYFYESDLMELDKTTEEACFNLVLCRMKDVKKKVSEIEKQIAHKCEGILIKTDFQQVVTNIKDIEDNNVYPFSCINLKERLEKVDATFVHTFEFIETTQPNINSICDKIDAFNLECKTKKEMLNKVNKDYLYNIDMIQVNIQTNPVISREYYLEAQKIYIQYKKLFDEAEYFYENDLIKLDRTIEEECFNLIIARMKNVSKRKAKMVKNIANNIDGNKLKNDFQNVIETLASIENETYYPFSCNTLRDRLVQTNPKNEEVFNFVETTQPQLDAICEKINTINLQKKIENDRLEKEKKEKEEAEEAERQLMAKKIFEYNNEGYYLENLANFLEREFSHESPSFIHPYSKIAVIVKQAYLFTKTFVSVDNKDILRIKSLYENINKITLENKFSFDEIILLLGAESATYYSEHRYKQYHPKFDAVVHKTKFEKIIKLLENNKRDTKELKKKFMLARSKDKKPEEIEKENALLDYREVNFQSHFKNYFTEDNEDENPEMVTLMKKYFNFCYNGNYTFTDKNIEIVNHLKKDFLEKLETVFGLQEEGYYDEAKNSLKDALIAKINLVEFLDFENITSQREKLWRTCQFVIKMEKILYSLGVAFEFFDLKYSELPKVLQDEIKLYNSVMLIKACSVVQYFRFMNTLDNVHQVYLNYNNNLVLKLQSVIRTLATQDYDITHDPIVTEYVRQSMNETVVDKNNLVLYESESKYTENMLNMYKPILSDGVSLTSSKNKLFTLNAVSQFLLSNYAFFDEVIEFSRNVNATLLNKENFGFIPNIFNLITSTVAIVNRTPQSDDIWIKCPRYRWDYESHFTEEIKSIWTMEVKMAYNYRVLLTNTNYSIVNYLLCKNWSSQYEYNILMINTITDLDSKPNFDFKTNENECYRTHMRWIVNNFGITESKRNYEIQLKSCVNAISGIISFAGYQLDRPKVFPSLNYFGASVPICKYTDHLTTSEIETKIDSTMFVETFRVYFERMKEQERYYKQNSIMSNAIFEFLRDRIGQNFKEICVTNIEGLSNDFMKERYDQFVGIYADCVTLNNDDESFVVNKTVNGFEVKAKLGENAVGNRLTFNYVFNKKYDKMGLSFDHGKCVKNENNVFVWTYKDYKAFDHTEELNYQFEQKDINLPKDLIVMISYIGKMELYYDLINKKVEEDIKHERMVNEHNRIQEMERLERERILWQHGITFF